MRVQGRDPTTTTTRRRIQCNVLAKEIWNNSYSLHLLQMLGCMIRMDHFVRYSRIIAAKDANGFTTRVIKGRNVVNDSFNHNFVGSQGFQGSHRFFDSIIVALGIQRRHRYALAQFVRIWSHGEYFYVPVGRPTTRETFQVTAMPLDLVNCSQSVSNQGRRVPFPEFRP